MKIEQLRAMAPVLEKSADSSWLTRGLTRVGKWATTPKGENPAAAGMTGINRWKQLLGRQRVKHLYDEYLASTIPEERARLLQELVNEDSRALGTIAATGMAAYGGTSLAADQLSKQLVGGVRWGGQKVLSSGATKEEKKEGPRGALRASVGRMGGGETAKNVAEHLALKGKDTDKITAEEVVGTPANALTAGVVGKFTGKTGLENILGAQSFYHGTDPGSATSIRAHGLDPAYGGRDGGVAHALSARAAKAKELRQQAADLRVRPDGFEDTLSKHLEAVADDLTPHMPVMSIGEKVPMDNVDFVGNAKGRSYVARGVPGQYAAGAYALEANPELKQKIMKDFADSGEMMSGGKKVRGIFKAYKDMYDNYQAVLHSPEQSRIVGGVLPHEDFHTRFEPDPDDITRFQTGWRTKLPEQVDAVAEKLHPANLAKNEASVGQIFKNRSKNWTQYAKNNKLRVAGGAALLAAPVALGGFQAARSGKRVIDKLRGKFTPEEPSA